MKAPYKKIKNYYFDPLKPVNKSYHGSVYTAFLQHNKQAMFTIKAIPMKYLPRIDIIHDSLTTDIGALCYLKDESVIQIHSIIQSANNLYIIMDYCNGRDLRTLLKNEKTLQELDKCSIIKQIANIFVKLESIELLSQDGYLTSCIHYDIKPDNIFYEKGAVKLSNFGLTKALKDLDVNLQSHNRNRIIAFDYTAPQVLRGEPYSSKCDVWSSGIVFYELLFGCVPWKGNSVDELCQIIQTEPLMFPQLICKDLSNLITGMLEKSERKRFSWREVSEHPALKESFPK